MNVDWVIYSIGSADFLNTIVGAISSINGSNFTVVASIGLVISALFAGFRSIIDGGNMPQFQHVLIGWLMYALMFGATVDGVTIEDTRTNDIYVQDNVPLGVAAGGFMMSNIGYGLTDIFQQAFSLPYMTDEKFGYALQALAASRKATISKDAWGKANSPEGTMDIWKSWANYVTECTMTGVDQNEYTVEDIRLSRRFGGATGSNALDQIRFDSSAYGTRIFALANDPDGQYLTCTDAHDTLVPITEDEVMPYVFRNIAAEMGLFNEPGADALSKAQVATRAKEDIGSAINILAQGSATAQKYAIATAMFPIFNYGVVQNELDYQRSAQAAMLNDAIQQRNMQWSAEQALFESVMYPIMTFFEGFVFAITPFMAFLVTLGPMGIKMIGKYMMLLIWIQLWMPVLAIINLYLHMAAKGDLTARVKEDTYSDIPLNSFYGIAASDVVLQNWIATGGMLAASVPAISLMLVYGSAITATNLAGKLQGGAHIDETQAAPASSNVGAAVESMPRASASTAGGPMFSGAKPGEISAGQNLNEVVSSTDSQRRTSSDKFASQLQETWQNGVTQSDGSSSAAISALTEGTSGAASQEVSRMTAQNLNQGDSLKESTNSQEVMRVMAAGELGASGQINNKTGGGEGRGTKGSVGLSSKAVAELSEQTGMSEEKIRSIEAGLQDTYSNNDKLQTQLTTSLAEDLRNEETSSYADTASESEQQSLSALSEEAYQDEQAYQRAVTASQGVDTGRTMDLATAKNEVNSDTSRGQELQGMLEDWKRGAGAQKGDQIEQKAASLERVFDNPEEQDQAAAIAVFAREGSVESAEFISELLGTGNVGATQEGAEANKGQDGSDVEEQKGQVSGPTDSASPENSQQTKDQLQAFGSVGDQHEELLSQMVEDAAPLEASQNNEEAEAITSTADNAGDQLATVAKAFNGAKEGFSSWFNETPADSVQGTYDDVLGDTGNPRQAAMAAHDQAMGMVEDNFNGVNPAIQESIAMNLLDNGKKGDSNPINSLQAEQEQTTNNLRSTFGEAGAEAVSGAIEQNINQNTPASGFDADSLGFFTGASGNEQAYSGTDYANAQQQVLDSVGYNASDSAEERLSAIYMAPNQEAQAAMWPQQVQAEQEILDNGGTQGMDQLASIREEANQARTDAGMLEMGFPTEDGEPGTAATENVSPIAEGSSYQGSSGGYSRNSDDYDIPLSP